MRFLVSVLAFSIVFGSSHYSFAQPSLPPYVNKESASLVKKESAELVREAMKRVRPEMDQVRRALQGLDPKTRELVVRTLQNPNNFKDIRLAFRNLNIPNASFTQVELIEVKVSMSYRYLLSRGLMTAAAVIGAALTEKHVYRPVARSVYTGMSRIQDQGGMCVSECAQR